MTGPQDPTAAGGDRLRASHADREQVIETLKDAFMQGRLTGDELGARAGRALAARTRADLAALTADIRAADIRAAGIPAAGIPAESADLIVAGPTRPPAPVRRRPLARAAAGSGGCLVIAFAALRLVSLADPGATPAPSPCPGLSRALSWPLPPWSRHCSSWGTGWAPQSSRDAPAGSCRPSWGRARRDAGEAGTGTGAWPAARAGLGVVARAGFPRGRAREQAARERAEPASELLPLSGEDALRAACSGYRAPGQRFTHRQAARHRRVGAWWCG